MEKFLVKITELYSYEIEVDAKSQSEALKKAKEYYENIVDGYVGVADGNSFEKAKFKVLKDC